MLQIKDLTIKNFMSVGNVTQAVAFENDLTLVLGENLDLGANGSRNGTGKTTIVNALSYALYGNALTRIKLGNLINKTNDKDMLVSVDFAKNGIDYRIERGRKPNIFKLFVNGQEEVEDESQGEMRETQKRVDDILGLSHEMFKHIVALNTYTEPFLNLKAADQRAVIEELLGITLLSEKADVLREIIKDSKDVIKKEEFRINAIKDSNGRIEEQLRQMETKSKLWNQQQLDDVQGYDIAIKELQKIDIESEVLAHKDLETFVVNEKLLHDLDSAILRLKREQDSKQVLIDKTEKEIVMLKDHKCHACGQDLHDSKQETILKIKETLVTDTTVELQEIKTEHDAAVEGKGNITLGDKPKTFYPTLEEALNHKHTLDNLNEKLTTRAMETNPYTEQIESMRTDTLQEIDYEVMNEATRKLDHEQFLLKLLTDKDSFVRKQIISQNLAFLNQKLTYYINATGLRHIIEFKDDLTVEITDLGKDFDFDNLSRGEKNRVILSTSWAFRDVWENLYNPINLLFVDEVIDSGMDDAGVENSLKVLKTMTREQNKSVWLISHKNELISRVNNVMRVVKENGFTNFSKEV